MSLYFYEPFFTVSDFRRIFDDAFSGATSTGRDGSGNSAEASNDSQVVTRGEGTGSAEATFRPIMDVHEDKEKNLITATFELPGMKKEDISIDVHNNRLVVSGETTFSKDTKEDGYIVKQRRRGKFSRMLPLPQGTQMDQIKAAMENGVLTVTFPKASPEQATKKITIA